MGHPRPRRRPLARPTYHQRWVDPYDARVWQYQVALAREALALGFGEVQWDYVRFPDVPDSVRATLTFPAQQGRTRAQAIRAFVATSRRALGGAPVTADVFGRVITEPEDSGIGQQWDSLATAADVLLPMVYPALYSRGSFNQPEPNAAPYEVVRQAMRLALMRTAAAPPPRARVRPWLQAFTLGNPPYGPAEVAAQVRGAADAGVHEWVLWNSEGRYPADVLRALPRDPAPGRGAAATAPPRPAP